MYSFLEFHESTIIYVGLICFGLFVMAVIMRPGSKRRKDVGNQSVADARLLIKAGKKAEARALLKEHLITNPGDDRAKALLKKTR